MRKLGLAACVLGVGLSLQADGLTVSPMLMYFHAGSNVQDITVSNADSTVEYASIVPVYLPNLGMSNASKVPFDGTSPQTFGLMVSPTKVAIQPGTSRKVRVVNLVNNVPQDRVYTLTISNINPTQKVEGEAHGSTAEMSMTYGYQIRIFVLPANPLPIISAKRSGNSVTITNSGNSYISLRSGQLCDTSGSKCKPLSDALSYHVLYAGNSWTYTLPTPGIVKYSGVYAETKNMKVESN